MNSLSPLAGVHILVTQPEEKNQAFIGKIEAHGGTAFTYPAICVKPTRNMEPLDHALQELPHYDWLIFTSSNGVRFFAQRLEQLGIKWKTEVEGPKIAVVGPQTKAAVEQRGWKVSLAPRKEYRQEGLFQILSSQAQVGERLLFPRSQLARPWLIEELAGAGFQVTDVIAYETVPAPGDITEVIRLLETGQLHIVTFTSPSSVHHVVHALRSSTREADRLLEQVSLACIGPVTAAAVEQAGLTAELVAEESTLDGLIAAMSKYQRNS
ncbi:uroporphyrinogen-III synthase [Mechercharimyces sp. CAU 1602]|uniref:uroporphyrinogen-III synthase n=1 Tax=Mechercharimyces sp. CAU 1602 TaxID=2973933 RepID=UPI00216125F8|nr:uroporphyrinogen-III synthase [Mechercharimyces sp. CAU 1602]MCS1351459.1 uroporphyrinogen-III synthase [Mechercharimyces sp. CAU 1602]